MPRRLTAAEGSEIIAREFCIRVVISFDGDDGFGFDDGVVFEPAMMKGGFRVDVKEKHAAGFKRAINEVKNLTQFLKCQEMIEAIEQADGGVNRVGKRRGVFDSRMYKVGGVCMIVCATARVRASLPMRQCP